jgi:Tc5 transposase DNA-binding domain
MGQRGFPTFLINLKGLDEALIARREIPRPTHSIGKNWVYRFIERHPALKNIVYVKKLHTRILRTAKYN